MNESEKIAKLFEAFYDGECWVGINFQQAIKGIDETLAARKRDDAFNSIWQLVNHIIYWRKTVMIRLQGVLGNPPISDFYQPEKADMQSWKETLLHFEEVQNELVKTIRAFPPTQLDKASPKRAQTNYQLLIGCLQHDCYHMGQIILLKKDQV
jgi:uncharacterized damage-inducible protein DinB